MTKSTLKKTKARSGVRAGGTVPASKSSARNAARAEAAAAEGYLAALSAALAARTAAASAVGACDAALAALVAVIARVAPASATADGAWAAVAALVQDAATAVSATNPVLAANLANTAAGIAHAAAANAGGWVDDEGTLRSGIPALAIGSAFNGASFAAAGNGARLRGASAVAAR